MAERSRNSELVLRELDGRSETVSLLGSRYSAVGSYTGEGMALQEDDAFPTIPALGENEKFHVFISFSSLDSAWVFDLLGKLEAVGLKVCYHGRDFVPGKLIIENMEDAIQRSQKTLMVLSPDFVRSGWCLFEANLSLLKDCMERKPIVPVVLKPCPIPLHLNHLTYLEANDIHFFRKLVQVLCTPNQQMRHASMIPYQPTALYNGKTLLTLSAVEEDIPKWQIGTFSDAPVPDQLRMLIEDPANYQEAIQTINATPAVRSCMKYTAFRVFLCIFLLVLAGVGVPFYVMLSLYTNAHDDSVGPYSLIPAISSFMFVGILLPITFIAVCLWHKRIGKRKKLEMAQRTGQANIHMMENSILIGCESTVKLHFIYISLEKCTQTFEETFRNGNPSAEEMLRKAILYFSSGYACCVAKKHFPSTHGLLGPGHLEYGTCFCQIAIALSFVVILQGIGAVPTKPQILAHVDGLWVPDSRRGPGDIQIEPPMEAEIIYDIDTAMMIIARDLQNEPGDDHLALLRSVSNEAEEDRDRFYHPSFQHLEEVPAARMELRNSQAVAESEEDRDYLHHP